MKKLFLFITTLIMICFINILGQTESQKAGSEYNVLDAWSGT